MIAKVTKSLGRTWMFCDATRPLFGPSYERHLPRMSPNVAANHASEMHRSRPRMKNCPPPQKKNKPDPEHKVSMLQKQLCHILLQFSTIFYRISKFKATRPTLKSYKVLVKAESGGHATGSTGTEELKSNEVIISPTTVMVHEWLMND